MEGQPNDAGVIGSHTFGYEPIKMILNPQEVENLKRNSEYYRAKFEFETNLDPAPAQTEIWVQEAPNINFKLSVYLIACNCESVPSLPCFEKAFVYEFAQISIYYGFETMMKQMKAFCVDLGAKYMFEYASAVCTLGGANHPILAELLPQMKDLITRAQMELPARERTEISVELFKKWMVEQNYTGLAVLIKRVVHSVSLRCRSFRPICPGCWAPIILVETACLSECCLEPVHIACYARSFLCFICKVIPSRLRRFIHQGSAKAVLTRNSKILRYSKYSCGPRVQSAGY